MIDYNPHSWFKLIFNTDSKNIFRQLWPPMVMLVLYTSGVVYVFNVYFSVHYPGATAIHSLLGVVLGLFLVFRTNTAYDRWWEGTKQWGSLVNACRNLSMKINTALGENHEEDKEFFAKMISNFAYAMKEHLREGVIIDEIQEIKGGNLKETLGSKSHPPLHIVNLLYEKLTQFINDGTITGEQLIVIDQDAKELMNVIGACERIKTTPIPYSYNVYIKKFIFLYSISLPFGIMSITHYWTVPIVTVVFYLLVSTELIAEEIEDPFGRDDNDLPTDKISAKIKLNVEEVLLSK